jgi:hypothetical protein
VIDIELLKALDKTFPALETFSLLVAITENPDPQALLSPQNFASPRPHTLYLENVDIFEVPSLLTSAATSLISLRIEDIEAPNYFPPDELVECISSMPQLEKLSISLLSNLLPATEREFWDTRITRTVLSSLRELTFGGDSAYLEKMLVVISNPSSPIFRRRVLLSAHPSCSTYIRVLLYDPESRFPSGSSVFLRPSHYHPPSHEVLRFPVLSQVSY